jgi:plasmid stability protein
MTTLQIHLPDNQAAVLKAQAAAHGLSLEDWISRKLAGEGDEHPARTACSPREAADRILELQKRVKPDPEGWTIRDYINFGRP